MGALDLSKTHHGVSLGGSLGIHAGGDKVPRRAGETWAGMTGAAATQAGVTGIGVPRAGHKDL